MCELIENGIDGKTLIGLTETMVARLLPRMNLQVQFLELQGQLKSQMQRSANLSSTPTSAKPTSERLDNSFASQDTSSCSTTSEDRYCTIRCLFTLHHVASSRMVSPS